MRGAVRFEDVLTDQSDDPAIARLRGVTSIVYDDDLDRTYPDRYATVVEIATRDAATHSCRVDYARGTVENPMSREEIVAKFDDLAGRRCDRAQCDHIRATVEQRTTRGQRSGAVRRARHCVTGGFAGGQARAMLPRRSGTGERGEISHAPVVT